MMSNDVGQNEEKSNQAVCGPDRDAEVKAVNLRKTVEIALDALKGGMIDGRRHYTEGDVSLMQAALDAALHQQNTIINGLREALKPFVYADWDELDDEGDSISATKPSGIVLGDVRRARRELALTRHSYKAGHEQ
jgi:hypothetical protein